MQLFFRKILGFLTSKRFLSAVFVVGGVLFLIFCPAVVFNKANYALDLNKFLYAEPSSQIVLSLYHVETFEGGLASRGKYLERVAVNFNKAHKNVYVVVKTLTYDELCLNLESGELPDMFSFGVGSGEKLQTKLQGLPKTKAVRQDLLSYGKIGGEQLAYPYMLSGYSVISRDSDTIKSKTFSAGKKVAGVVLAGKEFIDPAKSAVVNGFSADDNAKLVVDTAYQAYCSFVEGKSTALVGTLRDVHRCKNREANGTLANCSYEFLGRFTDLVQYVGIAGGISGEKSAVAKDFCEYLVSSASQKLLANYGLLSVGGDKIYDGGYMVDLENALRGELSSVNVFTAREALQNQIDENLQKLSRA